MLRLTVLKTVEPHGGFFLFLRSSFDYDVCFAGVSMDGFRNMCSSMVINPAKGSFKMFGEPFLNQFILQPDIQVECMHMPCV